MNKLAEKIYKLLELHKPQIEEALKEEGDKYELNFDKIKTEIEKFDNYIPKNLKSTDYLFLTNGNPNTTIVLICYAIFNNVNITIDTNRVLPNVNKIIADSFSDLAYIESDEQYLRNGKKQISQTNHLTIKQLVDLIDAYQIEDVYVVDDFKKYEQILSFKLHTIYLPIFSLDLYSNSKKYKEIENVIDEYCEHHFINLNIYNNESNEKIVFRSKRVESSNGILIFSKSEADGELIKMKVPNKKVYINYNPFDTFEIDMVEYFIKY